MVHLTLKGFVLLFTFIHLFIFRYFTWCISHLSLVIILDKISVFIHLEATTGRSSTK